MQERYRGRLADQQHLDRCLSNSDSKTLGGSHCVHATLWKISARPIDFEPATTSVLQSDEVVRLRIGWADFAGAGALKSIGAVLAANRGIGPGFDALRVALSLSVMAWHCWPVTNGLPGPPPGPLWGFGYTLVPMFFALSGFLVTGSATRLALWRFILSRTLRIVPALAVDTAISIILIGLLLTTLPKLSYLFDPITASYWLNCVGNIHYKLPGVFDNNPWQQVNKSLWTIPSELLCYVTIGLLMATSTLKRPILPFIGIAIILAVDCVFHSSFHIFQFPMERELAGPTGKLVCFFLAGSLAFLLRDRIPNSRIMAIFSISYIMTGSLLMPESFGQNIFFVIGACFAITYLMAWIGIQPIKLPWPFTTGDYSYGIYLYAFPIQQSVVYLTGTRSPIIVMVLSIIPVILLAMMSWHFVEKPTLKLRKFSLSNRRVAASEPNDPDRSQITADA